MSASDDKLSIYESIIDSLAHLISGSDDHANCVWPKARIQLYDGFEVFDPRMSGSEDDFVLLGSNPTDTPIWPMDARFALFNDKWLFKRVATLDIKRWRGKLKYTSPRMYELSETEISLSGQASGSTAPFAVFGDKIVNATSLNHPLNGLRMSNHRQNPRIERMSMEMEYKDIRAAQGVELRREYLWSVLLGEEGIPRARFVTDPIGIRAAFRLRDIPEGKARRAAIRHWVSEHWRKSRATSREDRAFVRQYLRGATEFKWNGLSCVVEPSRDDVRKNTHA